jgi:RIO-like serine/threonine protein kinase
MSFNNLESNTVEVATNKLESWSTLQPIPENFEIIIDNLKLLRIRQYLENKGLHYPDQKRYYDLVARSLWNENNYLGKGGKGRVYSFESPDGEDKKVCIKVMRHTRDSYHTADRGNDPIEEFRIQSDVASLNTDEITKCPRPLQLLNCKNDFYAFVMEELSAINLQNIILGNNALPESFNLKSFMDTLYTYVDNLHEIGVVHNDLEARNVMVDSITGSPYIIDFGRSVRVGYQEESLRAKKLRESDYLNLEKIEVDLRALLQQ